MDTIGSDHSPSPWNLKEDADFFKVWGGISGVQHLLPVLLDAGLEPELFSQLAAGNPAQRFCLPHKGRLEIGADADLTVFDPDRVIDKATFENAAQYSEGIQDVMVQGVFVLRDGAFVQGVYPGVGLRAKVAEK